MSGPLITITRPGRTEWCAVCRKSSKRVHASPKLDLWGRRRGRRPICRRCIASMAALVDAAQMASEAKAADRKRYVCVEMPHGEVVHTAVMRDGGCYHTLCRRVLKPYEARVVRMSPTTCRTCLERM